jgi:hypothetical protein
MINCYSLLSISVMLGLICSMDRVIAQNIKDVCPEAMVYENRNQVDYGPIKLANIHGQAILDYDGAHPGSSVPRVCLSLFTEDSHQWIETRLADNEGKYSFGSIKPGRYRMVARSPGLCSANIPLYLIKAEGQNSKRYGIVIHFTFQGREARSFGRLEVITDMKPGT